jgi:hypothetical protein
MAEIASTTDSTLHFLLERLNWPVRLVRLVAAREYAALLSSSSYGKRATTAYLRWLGARKTESEAATGLAVLLITAKDDLPAFSDVSDAISQPSIVADMLLQHIYGFGNRRGGWLTAHSGLVPDEFVVEKYFQDYSAMHVPLIFRDHIEWLGERYWFPFARQWASEWRKLMDRGGIPYSGFPRHFIGNLSRSDIIGQFDVAQSDVMRSAYLRMLACAVVDDAMTAQQAGFYAMDCLPLNRGLSRIMPIDRPAWLADVPERCCVTGASLETEGRKLIAANINWAGMRPVSLLTPLNAALYEFGDFTVSAVMATQDFVPPVMDEPYFCPGALWPLPDAITFEGEVDRVDAARFTVQGAAGRCIPVCLKVLPMPFGYWLADYLAAGLAIPASYLFDDPPDVTCDEEGIKMQIEGIAAAKLSIWHDHWTPLYAKDGGHTRCGILTEMSASHLGIALERYNLRLGWVAQLRRWSRQTDYAEYELTTQREFFFD